jgi:hypothetical protein
MAARKARRRPSTRRNTGGVAMPVGDLSGWTQIYAQDFTTPIALGNWESQAPALYGGQPGLGWYDGPDTFENAHPGEGGFYNANKTLSVTTAANANGVLDVYMHSESAAGGAPTSTDYTPYSAIVVVVNFFGADDWTGQTYGKFEWRTRADTSADGWKIATMLWPDPGPWEEGEVDYPEGNFRENDFALFCHASDGSDATQTPYVVDPVPGSTFSDWHVCGIEWDATSLRFYLDGALVGTRAAGLNGYITTPHRLTFQTETELGYAYDPGPPEVWFPVPWNTSGHYQLDWIVQYSKD